MSNWTIEFRRSATKEFDKLDPQTQDRLCPVIDSLAEDPFPAGHRKLRNTDRLYRVRVGDWRIVYLVDQDRHLVSIRRIAHRGSVYRNL